MKTKTILNRGIAMCLSAVITISLLTVGIVPVGAAEVLEAIQSPAFPYLDTRLSFEERATDLVSRMTPEEKYSQLQNGRSPNAPAIPRLGVDEYQWWSEALHGVARDGTATSFPTGLGIAATWNPDLVQQMMSVTSDEIREKFNTTPRAGWHGLSYWSPTINLARDPRWGRAEESYGEDPFLTSRIAGGFVRGLQGAGEDNTYLKAISTVKHFMANNSESNRHTGTSDFDERTLREYYGYAFKSAVEDAGVESVMTAYNRVNGIPSTVNLHILDDLLRRTWGFDGYVVTDCDTLSDIVSRHPWRPDTKGLEWGNEWNTLPKGWETWSESGRPWGGKEATALSLMSGTDANCGTTMAKNAKAAIEAGLMSEDDVDVALVRLFTARMRTGEFDPDNMVKYAGADFQPGTQIHAKDHQQLAEDSSDQAVVLLKNDPAVGKQSPILPLNGMEINNLVVVGELANKLVLGDYSTYEPKYTSKPLDGIQAAWRRASGNNAATATYISGVQSSSGNYLMNIKDPQFYNADGDFVRSVDWNSYSSIYGCEVEGAGNIGYNSKVASWVKFDQVDFSGVKIIKLDMAGATNASPTTVEVRIGAPDGQIIAKMTQGKGNTGGWGNYITYTFDNAVDGGYDTMQNNVYFVFKETVADSSFTADEQAKIRNADAVIVCVGTTEGQNGYAENSDGANLNLPGGQNKMIEDVLSLNSKTVVYIQAVSEINAEPFRNVAPAILWCTYNGQAQGNAAGRLLFGERNPSAKLPFTWYTDVNQLDDVKSYAIRPSDANAPIGSKGRTYQYFTGDVTYPFGYGLSYSSFKYSNLSISKESVTPDDIITIEFDIANTSAVDGAEVAQIYIVSPGADKVDRPAKRLKGFDKQTIAAGESAHFSIDIPVEDLYYWDEAAGKQVYDQGQYTIEVGSSSANIHLIDFFNLSGQLTPKLKTVSAIPTGHILDVTEPDKVISTKLSASRNDQTFVDLENAAVTYTSSKPHVAIVDSNGDVGGVGGGVATITASVTENGVTKTASFPVVVYETVGAQAIYLDGQALSGFSADKGSYTVDIVSTTAIPVVTVKANWDFNVEIIQATEENLVATVKISHGEVYFTYTITFVPPAIPSSPIFLDGKPLGGFNSSKLDYAIKVWTLPMVTAEAAGFDVQIKQATVADPVAAVTMSNSSRSVTYTLTFTVRNLPTDAKNPYMPLWEHIPDGEPRVFEDPDNSGQYRVYVYGSHDNQNNTTYCGYDHVVWSAPVEDLGDWRIENGGEPAYNCGGLLYAPDVVEKDGKYYLYTYDLSHGNSVAVSDRPGGPFVNMGATGGHKSSGIGNDPAILVDNDGKMYAYWGYQTYYQAEIDPETMAVKPGTTTQNNISNCNQSGEFKFYEGTSIRKVDGKYVMVYCQKPSMDPDSGVIHSNYRARLVYAYSDYPLGPWTYGGIIIDNGGELLTNGKTSYPDGNVHGGIIEADDQWYIFYHRMTNRSEYSRQAMLEPIEVTVDQSPGGKVEIKQAEMTSQGAAIDGLYAYKRYDAGIACYLTEGAYITTDYSQTSGYNPVAGLKDGCVVGYKYLNFGEGIQDGEFLQLELDIKSKGTAGTIDIFIDDPNNGTRKTDGTGTKIGSIRVAAGISSYYVEKATVDNVTGKHALFFVFHGEGSGEICEINDFGFDRKTALFQDNFTGGLEQWIVTGSPVSGKDGLTMTNGDKLVSKAGADWDNYAMELILSEGDVAIQFRRSDDRNFYTVEISGDTMALSVTENGLTRQLQSAKTTRPDSQTATLTVTCSEKQLVVRFDGSPVLVTANNLHRKGGIALLGVSAARVASVMVTNAAADEALRIDKIMLDGKPLSGFNDGTESYMVPVSTTDVPVVTATSTDSTVRTTVTQASAIPGNAVVRFSSPTGSKTYYISFYLADGETQDFKGMTKLPTGWSVINDTGGIAFSADGAVITTTGKDGPDMIDNQLQLDTPLTGDWMVETHFTLDQPLTKSYQQFGIYIYKDANNYIRVNQEQGGSEKVQFLWVKNGSWIHDSPQVSSDNVTDTYFRLKKTGNLIELYYSFDGKNFSYLGKETIDNRFDDGCKLRFYATSQSSANPVYRAAVEYGTVWQLSSKFQLDPAHEAIEALSMAIGNSMTIPAGEYVDNAAIAAKAKELLSAREDVNTLGAVVRIDSDDNGFVLTLGKGDSSCVTDNFLIAVEKTVDELAALISQAKALTEIDYSSASWERLEYAVNQAENLDEKTGVYEISAAWQRLKSALNALATRTDVLISISSPVSKLAAGYAANIPAVVEFVGEASDMTLSLHDPDGNVVDSMVVTKAGKYTFRIIPAQAIAGTYKIKAGGAEASIECVPLPNDIWSPEITVSAGNTVITFASDVSFNAAKKAVMIADVVVDNAKVSAEGKTVTIEQAMQIGQQIVISGVKYADLFPSYAFRFTITYQGNR